MAPPCLLVPHRGSLRVEIFLFRNIYRPDDVRAPAQEFAREALLQRQPRQRQTSKKRTCGVFRSQPQSLLQNCSRGVWEHTDLWLERRLPAQATLGLPRASATYDYCCAGFAFLPSSLFGSKKTFFMSSSYHRRLCHRTEVCGSVSMCECNPPRTCWNEVKKTRIVFFRRTDHTTSRV